MPVWSTACPDWERRIVARESLIPFPPLFPVEGTAAMEVFDELRIVDAPGSPRIGDAALPWARGFAEALFASYDDETGRRLISEFLLLISKKNWKSGIAASIMLTVLIRNWRQSGEFGILAPTIEVADNSFKPARDMIRADEELSALLYVQDHIRTITHRGTGATLKVVAADTDSVGGKKWIGTLVDELWLFGKKPRAEDMLREATGGMASRPEGFVVYLTTQSNEPPAGVFRQKLMYARGVRDGRINDPKFLPVLYEFPEKMIKTGEHMKPDNFYVTNPNLGASVDADFLVRGLSQAEEGGEESVRGFLSKHLNVEIGLALMHDGWPGADFWEQQVTAGLTLEEVLRRSEVVTIGMDGGGLDDLFGLAVLGREAETGNWLHWGHAWANPVVFVRHKQISSRLRDFEKAGDLSVAEVGEDIEQIADIVEKCEKSGLLDRIGVDEAGIGSAVDAITRRKIEHNRFVGIPQGWKLMGAIKTVERKLASNEMYHGGSPLMAWSVGNAKVEPRGNAIMITKQTSGSAKIDPLMALFDAAALMAMNPKPRRKRYQMMVY
jgi:phage terminase large subunit-like protein